MNLTRAEARERAALIAVDSYDVSLDLTRGETVFGSTTTVRFTAAPGSSSFFDAVTDAVHSVTLNGRDLGTLIGPTFHITIDRAHLRAQNVLAIEVANLMANRMSAMDREGVRWKTYYNVNFPSRLPENRGPDGLFTAATWEPLDSGLLGPVTLTPLAR